MCVSFALLTVHCMLHAFYLLLKQDHFAAAIWCSFCNAGCFTADQDNGWQGPLPDQDPGHLPGLEESLQRRTMYPAGRILHLVPARLVFDAEQLAKLGRPNELPTHCTLNLQEKSDPSPCTCSPHFIAEHMVNVSKS